MSVSLDLDALAFEKGDGLVTVVAQDVKSGAVLMVAHADREALEQTIATGEMHYRSRTRGLWRKGATSGNVQRVVRLSSDCDGDAVLAEVVSAGPACHTGEETCFGSIARRANTLLELDETIATRASVASAVDASPSYTQRLLADRNLRLKKLGEETAELVVALADERRENAIEEAADLFYHTLVALRGVNAGLADVERVLSARANRHRTGVASGNQTSSTTRTTHSGATDVADL